MTHSSGNLSTKSLTSIVNPKDLIQDSEYLDTHLIAVPKPAVKDFYKTYESLAPMVVPRSANEIASDDEFTLLTVVTFKKHAAEFVHKCREKRWTPRDYKYKEGGKEEEAREVDRLEKDERKLWGESLRLGRTGYSESAMIWIHVLALRVFVETVLRYGLPLDFVCGLVQVIAQAQSRRAPCANMHRRMKRVRKRRRATSMPATRTLAATRLAGTARVASRRTTRLRPTCRPRATWASRSTQPTSSTSLRLHSLASTACIRGRFWFFSWRASADTACRNS